MAVKKTMEQKVAEKLDPSPSRRPAPEEMSKRHLVKRPIKRSA